MKTNYISTIAKVAACIFAGTALLHADDKSLEKAKEVVRQIQQPEVKASTGTATAQQISQQQNKVEQVHQKAVAQAVHLDRPNHPVPAPVVSKPTTTTTTVSKSTTSATSSAAPKN